MMIMINPGLENEAVLPMTITLDNQIFFVSYNKDRDMITFNCFVDEQETRIFIEKIVRDYLTNGIRVLYY